MFSEPENEDPQRAEAVPQKGGDAQAQRIIEMAKELGIDPNSEFYLLPIAKQYVSVLTF
jgi:hypothetical protein